MTAGKVEMWFELSGTQTLSGNIYVRVKWPNVECMCQWWNWTKYIYSSTILEYFHFMLLPLLPFCIMTTFTFNTILLMTLCWIKIRKTFWMQAFTCNGVLLYWGIATFTIYHSILLPTLVDMKLNVKGSWYPLSLLFLIFPFTDSTHLYCLIGESDLFV